MPFFMYSRYGRSKYLVAFAVIMHLKHERIMCNKIACPRKYFCLPQFVGKGEALWLLVRLQQL